MNIRSLRPLSRDVPRSPAAGRSPLALPSPLLLLLALLVLLDAALSPRLAAPPAAIWRQKPLLGYFILTQSLAAEIERQGLLTQPQLRLARRVALLQGSELRRLQAESLPVVLDPALTLQQKRQLIREMGYNRRVAAISAASQQLLSLLLPASDYARFTAWAENRWRLERQLHGMASFAAAPLILRTQSLAPGPQIVTPLSALPAARSYKIFATRYDSGDRYAVALPDKCLKFSNAGNRLCVDDGYQINQGYFVYLSYDGETAAEVWESGPWNVDDNYWSTSRDPQPRRMFADLPAGMPEAQAAFFDGYNGGADQFGRTVIAPFGIDLGRKVSIDIGLQPGNNDWINITFAWTEGWDKVKKPGQGSPSQPAGQGASSTAAPTTPPLLTATPNPDGSVVHEVQPGQALWSIAIAYGVTLQDLYSLNGLSEGAVIRPGDKLVIIAAQPTPTPTQTLTPTGTLPPTPTRRPTSTPQPATLTPTVTWTPAPGSALPASTSRLDPLLLIIAGGAVVGGILLLVGVLLRRR